jgi:hypothetical protein
VAVEFVHADASDFVADEPVELTACVGATWIGDGVPGTLELLRRSTRDDGMILVGEPYWRRPPPDQRTVELCHAEREDEFLPLPELLTQFGTLGYDVVEMVLADQDSWDRYVAAQWLNLRRWLDENPGDELADQLRDELRRVPVEHVTGQREHLGWGVFALMPR